MTRFIFAFFLIPALALPTLPTTAHGWPHLESDLPPDPSVAWEQLDNGVRLVVLPNREPRDRVSLRLYVDAGSLHETDRQRGLAHFLEHMAFNGTENFAAGTLVEYFQRLGMSFGADTNAYTSFNRTVYMIELPETDRDSLDEGLLVLRDYAGRMLIDEEEVESERGVILSEKRSRDSVGYRTALAQFAFLLPESLIPNRFPIGTREVLETATRQDLVDFFDAWYRPGRTTLVIVGETDPAEVRELVERHFADFEARAPEPEEPDLGRVAANGTRAMLHSESEAPATRVVIHAVSPYEPEPDTAAARIERLHRSAALQMLTRRLDTLSKKDGAPFSRGSAQAYELFNFATVAGIELTGEPADWKEALRLAEHELRRALEHGFQAAELREIRADLANDLEEQARRAGTRRSPSLAEGIIGSLANNSVFTHPEDERDLMLPAIDAMTVEDCLRALRELWAPEGRFLFLTGNLELDDAEETILAVFEQANAEAVEPPAEMVETAFAYTDFGPAGEIVEDRFVEDLAIRQIRFANGTRLNLKTTDFEANTIRARLRVGAGRLTEPARLEGLGVLAGAAFTAGGLGEHSADELRRILAGRNVGFRFTVGGDAFEFNGNTTPDDLLLQLQLAAAFLTDPGYRPEALRQARRGFREQYLRARHTAQGVLQNDVARFLASGDHRFGLPPEEILMERTLEELADWLEEPLGRGWLEVSLVGELDEEAAITAAAATLGALPPRADLKSVDPALRRVAFPRDAESRVFTFPSTIPQAFTVVTWPTTDAWDVSNTRRLTILARAFSDRMRVRIREEMGEAYSPFAVSQPSDTFVGYGLFNAIVGVDPAKTEEVAEAVLAIAADLANDGIDEDELERARRPVLTSLRDTVRDNGYWMNSVVGSSREFPQRLDWARTMLDDFDNITVGEINALARRHLRPDAALRLAIVPVQEEITGEENP